MSVQDEIAVLRQEIAAHSVDLANLKAWQQRQNGDIQEIRRMVFNVLILSISTLATALLTLLGVVLK
ncbi:MAG: hypothetical protein ACPLRW_07835 [Moorellales bacterium]